MATVPLQKPPAPFSESSKGLSQKSMLVDAASTRSANSIASGAKTRTSTVVPGGRGTLISSFPPCPTLVSNWKSAPGHFVRLS